MQTNPEELEDWIKSIAALIEKDAEPDPKLYSHFLESPHLASEVISYLDTLDEKLAIEGHALYSACVFASDLCVNQLHSLSEYGNKLAARTLSQLMDHIAKTINNGKHSISFWLPILNAFYESQVALSDNLKNAYFNLATDEEDELVDIDEGLHLDSIRDLLKELSDLSDFDVAENFFAQSYAMPADFFADLLIDLYSIEEGAEIALLTLLHPNTEVRAVVVHTLDSILPEVTLSSRSLSRLQAIMYWYPESYHPQFNRWIKAQRKKGVTFASDTSTSSLRIKASEVDGSGSQGIFVHVKKQKNNRLCGVLLKDRIGIKDAWVTPIIPIKDVARYYDEAFDETVTLREVGIDYLQMMVEHFLALSIEQGEMFDLHLLELQELLGIHLKPNKLDIEHLFTVFAIQISPFTEETLQESFKRSKSWAKNKRFTESWFIENPQVDKLVNRCSNFVDGVKVCRFEDAMDAVFAEEMELHRDKWAFHFLWIALWARAKPKKNERIAEDSFYIAYAIHQGRPLHSIPLMQDICRQSVINSVETMRERGTHLG